MSPARIEVTVWVLIYGGLLSLCLGVALVRQGSALGWALVACGGTAAAFGALLIWVRSRMRAPAENR